MNNLHAQQVSGGVVDEDGRRNVVRQLTGGACRSCGRIRGKTVFCTACGATVCWTCLRGTRCDLPAPDGFAWSHGRAMRLRTEEREKRKRALEVAHAAVAGREADGEA